MKKDEMNDTNNDYELRFKKFQIQDLIYMIKNPIDYMPEAIDAAKKEIAKRDINSEELCKYIQEADERIAEENQHSTESLNIWDKVIAAMVPNRYNALLVMWFENRGHSLKAKEANQNSRKYSHIRIGIIFGFIVALGFALIVFGNLMDFFEKDEPICGIPSPQEMEKCFSSAQAGNIDAMNALGDWPGISSDSGYYWKKKAAELGQCDAQLGMENLCLRAHDTSSAKKWVNIVINNTKCDTNQKNYARSIMDIPSHYQ